jgi:uncharacterized protein YxeA
MLSIQSMEREMKVLLAVMVFLISAVSFADGYKYDPNSGNSYYVHTDNSGNTQVRGNNIYTGSTWNTTVDSNGNERGTDSRGNMWNYNRGSGVYQNYGTGKICTGSGAFRTCTGG